MVGKTQKVSECRVCNKTGLETIIDFGDLALTGVFLQDGVQVNKEPLLLCRCKDCGLVQLGHNYSESDLYGDSYGYESHLNNTMVQHLQQTAKVLEMKHLKNIDNPIVVDIASNDGTLLSGYAEKSISKIGIDPLLDIVSDHYPPGAQKIRSFFSSKAYWRFQNNSANLVTSLSVLYDLNDPITFARGVNEILVEDGIWYFEQSYLPLMLETISYDTVCHEHLLYLSLHDIKRILEVSGFMILDASINSTNGGSIAITAVKTKKSFPLPQVVSELLASEIESGIVSGAFVRIFAQNYHQHMADLKSLLNKLKSEGADIIGFGASTKGNVLLQAIGVNASDIRAIGDINPRKFGKQTPGSGIPIVSEKELVESAGVSTVALVLPWHFREGLIKSLKVYLSKGGRLVFPLPVIEVVSE